LSVLRFLLEVKDKCINKDFVVITDRLPAYRLGCKRLGIKHLHERFGKRSLVESVFSSLKQVTRRFFNNVNVVFKKEIKRRNNNLLARRVMEILELFCLEFIVYFNYLRGDGY
jgi:transposase-like protein